MISVHHNPDQSLRRRAYWNCYFRNTASDNYRRAKVSRQARDSYPANKIVFVLLVRRRWVTVVCNGCETNKLMWICQLLTCCLDVQACDVIKELRSFLRFVDHANLSDRLDVIAKYKCVAYMFKLLRLVSKLSVLENYFVPTGRKDFSPEESAELKSVTHSILKRLHEKEFSALQRALESRGGLETTCVFFPTHERLGRRVVVEPQVVLFRVFRLPQVRSSAELKRSPCCSTRNGLDKKVCINPYHYSAIMNTGKFCAMKFEILLKALLWQCLCSRFYNIFCISFAYETVLSRFAVFILFVIYVVVSLAGPVSAIYTTLPSTMEVKNEESSGMYIRNFVLNRVSCLCLFQTFNPSASHTDIRFTLQALLATLRSQQLALWTAERPIHGQLHKH